MATPSSDSNSSNEDKELRPKAGTFPEAGTFEWWWRVAEFTLTTPTRFWHGRTRNRAYTKALELGEVLVTYGRVMMIGAGGAGKTSLRHGLMKKPLPRMPFSTLLVNCLSVKCQWARAGDSSGQRWIEIDGEDEISELATLLSTVLQKKSLLQSAENASAIKDFQPSTRPDMHVVEKIGQGPESASISSGNLSDVVKEIREEIFRKARVATSHRRPQSEVLLNLWDSGGQVIFMNVLPAFLTKRTLFMLVFDASKHLETKLEVVSVRAGKIVHTEDYHLNTTELLLQWMASIDAHLSLRRAGAKVEPYPRVMLIGTHLDQLVSRGCNPAEVSKSVLDSLHSQYKDKTYADLLMPSPGYVVDNTTAGQEGKEDPAFNKIRKCVREFASDNLSVPTPITWVLFRKVMQTICQENKPVMKYSDVIAVAEACSIPLSALPSVLNFYHELGVFLYYSNIPSLRDIIIVNPQWLISHIAKLLTPRGLEDHGRERLWALLRDKGILTETLYKDLLVHDMMNPQALVDLLEHFLLAVSVKTDKIHPYNGKEYFVPCMLEAPSGSTAPHSPRHEAKPMHLIFDTHYVPPGFYVRLLAAVARNPHCKILFRPINRFTVTFAYQEVDEITIREYTDSIEVQITRADQGGPHVPLFPQVCRDTLELMNTSVQEVYTWLPAVLVSTAFACSRCSSEEPKHFVTFDKDTLTTTTVRCQQEKPQQLGLSQSQKCWLKVQEQRSSYSGVCSVREEVNVGVLQPQSQAKKGVNVQGTVMPRLLIKRGDIKLVDLIEHIPISRWFELGLALGVDDRVLRFIEADTRGDSQTGLRHMFQKWLDNCEQPSWDNVIGALRRIGEKRLAAELRLKLH